MEKKQVIRMRWIIIVLLIAGMIAIGRFLPVERGIQLLENWVENHGYTGMIVYSLIYIAATVLFLPGAAVTLAAGAIFGLAWGMVVVSIASTTGATLAFIIARYLARDRVVAMAEKNPKFRAIDKAIKEGGWKIVAMLRLSPAIPFNALNYLLGLTPVKLGQYIVASWFFMLPGTLMYVYLGYLGKAAATDATGTVNIGQWVLRILGLIATIAVTVYITKLARKAINENLNDE